MKAKAVVEVVWCSYKPRDSKETSSHLAEAWHEPQSLQKEPRLRD